MTKFTKFDIFMFEMFEKIDSQHYIRFYIQPGPLPEFFTVTNQQSASNRIRISA